MKKGIIIKGIKIHVQCFIQKISHSTKNEWSKHKNCPKALEKKKTKNVNRSLGDAYPEGIFFL